MGSHTLQVCYTQLWCKCWLCLYVSQRCAPVGKCNLCDCSCVCVSYRAGYRERQSTVWVWFIENKIKYGWNNESRWVMQCVRLIFPRSRMSQAVPVLFSSACMQNNKVYNWASTVEVFICMSARPRKHTSLSWRCLLPTSVCQHLCYNKNKPARPSSRLASEFAGQNRTLRTAGVTSHPHSLQVSLIMCFKEQPKSI